MHEPHHALYRSFDRDLDTPCTVRAGKLPEALSGSLYRVGPGVQQLGDDVLAFFDGHTLAAAVHFRDGQARLVARHVRTPLFEEEMRAKRQLKRRAMTNLPGWWRNVFAMDIGSTPQQDIVALGGRLFAISEQAWWELDPETLATRGPTVPVDRGAQDWLAFMPRLSPDGTRLVAQVVRRRGLKPDTAEFFELDRDLKVHRKVAAPLGHNNAFVHEQAYTPRWHVQFEFPHALSPLAVLAGTKPVISCLAADAEACVLHLVPRDGGPSVAIPCPAGVGAIFHLANAYEDGDRVIVDAAVAAELPDLCTAAPPSLRARQKTPDKPVPPARLVRFTADPKARTVTVATLADMDCEQPIVNRARFGQRHRYVYTTAPGAGAAESFLQYHAIARVDTEGGGVATWDFGPHAYVGQVSFAAYGTEEDDGWLLTWVLDTERDRTDVAIFDARAIERGPVAVLDTGHALPGYNHGRFYA